MPPPPPLWGCGTAHIDFMCPTWNIRVLLLFSGYDMSRAEPSADAVPRGCPCALNQQPCRPSAARCLWAGYDPRECLSALEGRACSISPCPFLHAQPSSDAPCPCAHQRGQCAQGPACRFRGHAPNECIHFLLRGQCNAGPRCANLHRSIGATVVDPRDRAAVEMRLRETGSRFSAATVRSLCLWRERQVPTGLIMELVRAFHLQVPGRGCGGLRGRWAGQEGGTQSEDWQNRPNIVIFRSGPPLRATPSRGWCLHWVPYSQGCANDCGMGRGREAHVAAPANHVSALTFVS